MAKLLIKNGWVVDPANNINEPLDILIEGSRIIKVGRKINNNPDEIIDAKDKKVLPGLVDMHVHLRQPGREDKETIATGTRAAAKGGLTSVLAMPNTEPAIDSCENIKLLKELIAREALVNVYISAAITKLRQGKELTDITALKKACALAITDDGASVDSEKLMLSALKLAKSNKIPVICHCEDRALSAGGVVNLGFTSTRLGLRGISSESEYKRVARDISLAQRLKANIHIAHVSTKESVELIAKAKKCGVRVTAETAPHYFALTEEAVLDYDTNMKMNPPLRSNEDKEAIIRALQNGTIDVIASDHAPHTENEKEIEFERAEFGVIGLETILAASVTELVHTGKIDWPELVRKLALNPARILGIDKGTLSVGKTADITIVEPQSEWVLKKEEIVSKSKNSCFLDRRFKGEVAYTICAGKLLYQKK